MPGFIESLTAHGFKVESQARWSPGLVRAVDHKLFPIYDEKDRAGLRILDSNGGESLPRPVPGAGLSRLRQHSEPDRRHACCLSRIATYSTGKTRSAIRRSNGSASPWPPRGRSPGSSVSDADSGGASTLATQIEKFRHSPSGRTGGARDKLRQMITASLRAYYDGPDTLKRREEIVTAYLNSTPLASVPGYGEIIGLPDALWIWFGTDLAELTKILNEIPRSAAELARQGEIYRQVLAFVVSGRRPSYYLLEDRDALGVLIDNHLYALANAGIISPSLRDAALNAELHFRAEPPPAAAGVSYVQRKATEQVRNRLVGLLHLPDLYALDRLDLTAETSIDTDTQARVASVMERLSEPAFLRSAGMYGHGLLNGADPSKIAWSFVLYERGEHQNHVRVHADSLNRPFDINSGSKLQLGSTAKLRTLVTYLQIVAELHQQLADMPPRELSRLAASADDALSGWAASYLARANDRSLEPMLEAALQRRYSAAPEQFFTGGGAQTFANFASLGRLRQPDRPRGFREFDQPVVRPRAARRPELLHRGGRDRDEEPLERPGQPAARRVSAALRRSRQPAFPVPLLPRLQRL